MRTVRGESLCQEQLPKRCRAFFYGCMTHHLRGRTACTNNLLTPMDRPMTAVLAGLERDVLHPDVTKTVVFEKS